MVRMQSMHRVVPGRRAGVRLEKKKELSKRSKNETNR